MYPLLFAPRAGKVMRLAVQEALRLNHEYIGTEHILIALIREGSGVTPNMLKKVDRDLGKIRRELEKTLPVGPTTTALVRLQHTTSAKKSLEYAEARGSGHPRVEAEHILLGLLREPEGITGQVLLSFGLDIEELRAEIGGILRQPDRAEATPYSQPSGTTRIGDINDR